MLVNVKIGPKLIGGFAAVALLCGAVGLIGITAMTSIKERVDEVTGLTVPQLDKLSEYQVGLAAMRRYEFGLSLAKAVNDETLYSSYIDDAKRDRASRVDEPRAGFEAIPRSTEAEALWAEVKRQERSYLASFDEAVAAYLADRDTEAAAIVLGSVTDALRRAGGVVCRAERPPHGDGRGTRRAGRRHLRVSAADRSPPSVLVAVARRRSGRGAHALAHRPAR
jgi:methyl-accepting chemotaxis protein